MNSEAEKGPAADPLSWVRGCSNEHPSALIGHTNLKVWNFNMSSSAFSNQSGGLNSEGAYDGASPAGCSFQVDGGTSKLRCDQAQTAQRLWAALFTTLHLRGFDTNWKQNLFCHKRRSSTHRESVYGWLSTDLVIHEDDWQHERRHEWWDKKERSKETRHRSATCTLH